MPTVWTLPPVAWKQKQHSSLISSISNKILKTCYSIYSVTFPIIPGPPEYNVSKLNIQYCCFVTLKYYRYVKLSLITEIWPKIWFCKGHGLERIRSQWKTIGSIIFLDLKQYRSQHQNCHPKCFSSKVIVKALFLHNGANVMHLRTSQIHTIQNISLLT